jgi:threonine/homoserine/homoserine lactone efflux protein
MKVEQAIAFVLFAIVAAMTPGPSNLLLTSTGATVGVRRGLPCLTGVALGMGTMIFLVGFGLGSIVLENLVILQIIRWSGVAFLLWLSWKIATAGRTRETTSDVFVGLWQAAAFQWVNPKAWLISASAVGTFLDAETGGALAQSLYLSLLFVLAVFPGCFVWLAFGAALQRLLQAERAARVFNIAMAALLAGSVLLFVR